MATGDSDVTLDFIRSVLSKASTDTVLSSDPVSPEPPVTSSPFSGDQQRAGGEQAIKKEESESDHEMKDSENQHSTHKTTKQTRRKKTKRSTASRKYYGIGQGSSQSADVSDQHQSDDHQQSKYQMNSTYTKSSSHESDHTDYKHDRVRDNCCDHSLAERSTSRPRKRSPRLRRKYIVDYQPMTHEDMLSEKYTELRELLSHEGYKSFHPQMQHTRHKLQRQLLRSAGNVPASHGQLPVYMRVHLVQDVSPRSDCAVQTDAVVDSGQPLVKPGEQAVSEEQQGTMLIDATDCRSETVYLSERQQAAGQKKVSFGGHEVRLPVTVKNPQAVHVPSLGIDSDSSVEREERNDTPMTPRTPKSSAKKHRLNSNLTQNVQSPKETFITDNKEISVSQKDKSSKFKSETFSPKSLSDRSRSSKYSENGYTSDSKSDSSPSPSRAENRSDHQLRNLDNPKIKSWLKKKNKIIRQQKREERRKERAKLKEALDLENQKVEKMQKSEKLVKQWMRKKKKESRLLRRKQKTKVQLVKAVDLADTNPGQTCDTPGLKDDKQPENGEANITENIPEINTNSLKEREPIDGQEVTTETQPSPSKPVIKKTTTKHMTKCNKKTGKQKAGEEVLQCTCGFMEAQRLKEEEEEQTRKASDLKSGKKAPVKTEYEYIRPTAYKAVMNARASKPSTRAVTSGSPPRPPKAVVVDKEAEAKKKEEELKKKKISYEEWLKNKRVKDAEKKKVLKQQEEEKLRQSDPEMAPIVSKVARQRADALRGRRIRIDTGIQRIDDQANTYPQSSSEMSVPQDGETSDSNPPQHMYLWKNSVLSTSEESKESSPASKRPSSSKSPRTANFKAVIPPKTSHSPSLPTTNKEDKIDENGPNPYIIPVPPADKLTATGKRASARRQKYAKFVEQKLSEERPEPQGCDQPNDSNHDNSASDTSSLMSMEPAEKPTNIPPISTAVTEKVYNVLGPSTPTGMKSPKSVVFAEQLNEEITIVKEEENERASVENDGDLDKRIEIEVIDSQSEDKDDDDVPKPSIANKVDSTNDVESGAEMINLSSGKENETKSETVETDHKTSEVSEKSESMVVNNGGETDNIKETTEESKKDEESVHGAEEEDEEVLQQIAGEEIAKLLKSAINVEEIIDGNNDIKASESAAEGQNEDKSVNNNENPREEEENKMNEDDFPTSEALHNTCQESESGVPANPGENDECVHDDNNNTLDRNTETLNDNDAVTIETEPTHDTSDPVDDTATNAYTLLSKQEDSGFSENIDTGTDEPCTQSDHENISRKSPSVLDGMEKKQADIAEERDLLRESLNDSEFDASIPEYSDTEESDTDTDGDPLTPMSANNVIHSGRKDINVEGGVAEESEKPTTKGVFLTEEK